MDAQEFLILESDIAAQLENIDDAFARVQDRAQDFNSDEAPDMQLESMAFQIHNTYNAIEELLRLIAAHFENQISDVARWHAALLHRMALPIPGVRPAPLSKETFHLLDALRGFRHFFRHAYMTSVDPGLLQSNLQRTRQAHSLLHRDITEFLEQIRPAK